MSRDDQDVRRLSHLCASYVFICMCVLLVNDFLICVMIVCLISVSSFMKFGGQMSIMLQRFAFKRVCVSIHVHRVLRVHF